jgi:hypothetical protein
VSANILKTCLQDIENHLRQLADKIRTEEEKHDNMTGDVSDEEFEGWCWLVTSVQL